MKKIPPWGWAVGAFGAGLAFYLYKKSKESQEVLPEETGVQPVAEATLGEGELPYGYGGAGAAGGIESGLQEQSNQQAQFDKEQSSNQSEFEKNITTALEKFGASTSGSAGTTASTPGTTINIGSSGGAPTTPTPGVTVAPVTSAPAYKTIMKAMTGPKGDKKSCQCHVYTNKPDECQHISNGACVW